MGKLKNYLILGLIIAVAAIFLIKDSQVDKWKSKYEIETALSPDTVTFTLKPPDTTITHTADSSNIVTEYETINDTIYVFKVLTDTVKQPLFELSTIVNSRTNEFTYKFVYKPLIVRLSFNDKYDLRKNFTVFTEPDIGKVEVDFGAYKPESKKKFQMSFGLGYSKFDGPILLSGVHWKKNEVGVFAKEKSYGFYFKRVFISLF